MGEGKAKCSLVKTRNTQYFGSQCCLPLQVSGMGYNHCTQQATVLCMSASQHTCARYFNCGWVSPTCGTPCRIAIVAGTAPLALTCRTETTTNNQTTRMVELGGTL